MRQSPTLSLRCLWNERQSHFARSLWTFLLKFIQLATNLPWRQSRNFKMSAVSLQKECRQNTPSNSNQPLDSLENLEVMLHVIQTFGDELPPACQNSCEEAWAVFDSFLAKYGSDYDLGERTTRVLRHGLILFGSSALPVAASAMARLTAGFDTTGFPSNLWIAGKIIQRFGSEESPGLRGTFQEAYEHSTQKVISLLQTKSPGEIPDGMLHFP